MDKKEFKLISFILVGSVGFTLLGDPLEDIFNNYWDQGAEHNMLIAGIIVRLVLIGLLFFLTRKMGFYSFNGFRRKVFVRNKSVLYLPFLIVIAGILINWEIYVGANDLHLTLIVISVLCVGMAEELCFRGLILPLSINAFKNKNNALYLGLILSSVLFGLVHYTNYFDISNFRGVTSQVIYAIAMGVFLGALMLRTGNILTPAFFHAAFNFLFGHGLIDNNTTYQSFELVPSERSLDWLDLLGSVLLFVLILTIGLNMIKLVNREAVQKDLKRLKI